MAQSQRIRKYRYNLGHQSITAGRIGTLVPITFMEVAPGDVFSGICGSLIRFSPLKRAVLQDLYVDYFAIYVPHRLVSADWETFVADGPMAAPNVTLPTVTVSSDNPSYESCFMRANTGTDSTEYSALRLYAYNLAYNDLFRDEQEPIIGPDSAPGTYGRAISFKKEYWTTLRNTVGKGDALQFIDTNKGGGR